MSSTIVDVAKLAGTSIATVSRVINKKSVRPENYKKVIDAIKELDFEVNKSARSLKTKQTYNIGIVVPYLDFVYFMRMMKYAQRYLQEKGYSVFIVDSDAEFEREKMQVKRLVDLKVDGLIISLSTNSAAYLDEIAPDIPTVLIDKIPIDCERDLVLCDGVSIVHKAVELFIQNGHERIAIMCGPEHFFTGSDRFKGYTRALEDYRIPMDPVLVKRLDYSKNSTDQAMTAMKELLALEREKRPTALIAASYDFAKGALIVLQNSDVNIPDDLSFIGYDFEELHDFYLPKLSMVFENYDAIGVQIARLLLRRLKDNSASPEMIRLKSGLALGKSIKKLN